MPDASGPILRVARSELLLGSDMAAKRAHARRLADAWLLEGQGHRVVVVETARGLGRAAWLAGLAAEGAGNHTAIAADQAAEGHRGNRLVSMEEPTELAHALGTDSRPDTLIVVDCLTLWLTASMMRAMQPDASDAYMATGQPTPASIADAVRICRGPLVIVGDPREPPAGDSAGNEDKDEDALQPSPSRDARRLLEALGDLQQQAAAACERVSLVARGQVHTLKDARA